MKRIRAFIASFISLLMVGLHTAALAQSPGIDGFSAQTSIAEQRFEEQFRSVPAGNSALGAADPPVASIASITVVHARSRHSSTCAASVPVHRSVGRRDVVVAVDSGDSGRAVVVARPGTVLVGLAQ